MDNGKRERESARSWLVSRMYCTKKRVKTVKVEVKGIKKIFINLVSIQMALGSARRPNVRTEMHKPDTDMTRIAPTRTFLYNFSNSLLTITEIFWLIIGTSFYAFGSYERHFKLTEEMYIPLRPIPRKTPFMVDVSINFAININWPTKVLDTRKVTLLNRLRQESVNTKRCRRIFVGAICLAAVHGYMDDHPNAFIKWPVLKQPGSNCVPSFPCFDPSLLGLECPSHW